MVDTKSSTAPGTSTTTHERPNALIRPRILLTGLRRSGKTSIQRVIFNKMQPSKTQFLKSTPHLTSSNFSCGSFINFEVQELPGQLHAFPSSSSQSSTGTGEDSEMTSSYDDAGRTNDGHYDMSRLLKRCNAIVYIIDAQDDYHESIARLNMIIQLGMQVNPKIRYEVFIHKVDQLSEDAKSDAQRDIHNQVADRFLDGDEGIDPSSSNSSQEVLIKFHLTSIYDHSIFEAFSKVIQKLLPQFNHLEYLLNCLRSASNIELAFLFDIQTKISIATDSSPTDVQMYELCCDTIDLLLSVSEIYGQPNGGRVVEAESDLESDDADEPIDNNNMYSYADESYLNGSDDDPSSRPSMETTDEPVSQVFDPMSSSVIKLTGDRALYLKQINRHLALICVLRNEALSKEAIIDHNVKQLKESILQLFRLNHHRAETTVAS